MPDPGLPDSGRNDDLEPNGGGSTGGGASGGGFPGSGDEPSGDAFWRALRRELEAAEAADATDANDLAAAEQLLAGLDAPSERLTDDRIDAMVARAVAGNQLATRPDEDELDGPAAPAAPPAPAASPRPARVVAGSFGRLRRSPLARPLFAAAALLLAAPGYITAASVAATVIVATYMLQNTADTLQFEDAIAIVMNSNEATSNRMPAQGRVAMDVIESVQLLHEVAGGNDAVAFAARDALMQLKNELNSPSAFSYQPFPEPILAVGDRVLSTSAEPAQRIAALQLLTAMAAHGISALLELERRELAPMMRTKLDGHLSNIRRWVNR